MEAVLLYLVGIVFVAIGVIVSIALHEAGHLIPAKLFGVRVGQYMIGFGKTLWSRTIRGTEYGVKALPLGGYISMSGMYPPLRPGGKVRTASAGIFQKLVQDAREGSAATIREGEEEHAFYRLAIWKRIVVMLGGPTINLVIAVVLYAIILVAYGAPATIPTISAVNQCVVSATSTGSPTKCAPDATRSPAAVAGFTQGDVIVSINGTKVSSWVQATKIIRGKAQQAITVVVRRHGHNVSLTATPIRTRGYVQDSEGNPITDSNGKYLTEEIGFLGLAPTIAIQPQPLSAVVPTVWKNTTAVGNVILHYPQRVVGVVNAAFGSGPRDPNGPIGLVGVGRIAGQISAAPVASFSDRFFGLLQLLASLNIALFVFNLVPLLPLDGGHILGALWEGLRRGIAKLFGRRDPGPVDTARVVPLTFVVVIVLGAVTVLLMYADIVKPITLY